MTGETSQSLPQQREGPPGCSYAAAERDRELRVGLGANQKALVQGLVVNPNQRLEGGGLAAVTTLVGSSDCSVCVRKVVSGSEERII